MKVAAYLRVSSESQTIDNQRADFDTWIKNHNLAPEDVAYYSESESAWKVGHQKELARLLNDVRGGKRKYDVLVVWSLDRLTRQGIGTILQLINSLRNCGCRVVSLKESFLDYDSNFNEVFIAFIAWAAKFESDRKSERVRAAHARLREQGVHIGRPKGATDKNPNGRRKAGYFERWRNKE